LADQDETRVANQRSAPPSFPLVICKPGSLHGIDAEAPWKRQTSTGRTSLASVEGLPKRIRVVLAGRLYVEKEGVPSPLLNAIKRLAAFQNPEFYKRQSMRLSTALTPRVIGCAEDIDGKAIAFPGAALQAAGGQSNFN